jgi:hypothetical protein
VLFAYTIHELDSREVVREDLEFEVIRQLAPASRKGRGSGWVRCDVNGVDAGSEEN